MAKTLMEALPLEPEEEPDEPEGRDLLAEIPHDANLADNELLSDAVLSKLVSDLLADFEADKRTIEPSLKIIEKGIDLLGVTLEELTEPFEGACSAVYPLMLEAAVQFQARAIAELFPSQGPVKTQIMGINTHERVQQAARVKEFMNYQLTEVMDEYFDELDQMLFTLPIVGSCFKKLYYDPSLGRPVSRFIPLEQFVVAYHNTDLRTAGRYTHITTIGANELRKLQVAGIYCNIDLVPGPGDATGRVTEKINKIEGRQDAPEVNGDRFTLLEMHVDLDLEGFEDKDADGKETEIALPYVVIIEKNSNKILALRRNWDESDPLRKRQQWFVHYKYLPGLGFYGYGLVHILGNLQRSATAILRSLVDGGQYATLPAFFKARGARVTDGNKPVSFGEYRDVDNFGDDLNKAIVPIPTKEPSVTLFQLLQNIVDAARRLASIADLNVGDSQGQDQPVGTTLALLEQAVKVMSAIHKRLHKSQREELRILARVNKMNLPAFYPYEVEGGTREIKAEDFSGRVNVLPVSDPNIFSETQRILRAQAMLQLATQVPQVHNMREAAFRMHESIGTPKIDDVLVPDYGPKPMDPATENYAILHGKPVMAYAYQDHMAHVQSHMAFMQDPHMGGNPTVQQIIMPAMMGHLADHQAHAYRLQIQAATGMPLNPAPHYDPSNPNRPDDYEPLPPVFENMVARKQAMAGQQIAQNAQIAQQAQQNQQVMQNPMYQLEQQKLAIEKQKADTQALDSKLKNELKARELEIDTAIAQADRQGEAALEMLRHKLEQDKAAMEQRAEQLRMQHDGMRTAMELHTQHVQSQIEQVRAAQEMQAKAADQELQKQKHHQELRQAQHEMAVREREHQLDVAKTKAEHALEVEKANAEMKLKDKELAAKAKETEAKAKESDNKIKQTEAEHKNKLKQSEAEHGQKLAQKDAEHEQKKKQKDTEHEQKLKEQKLAAKDGKKTEEGGAKLPPITVNVHMPKSGKKTIKAKKGKDGTTYEVNEE